MSIFAYTLLFAVDIMIDSMSGIELATGIVFLFTPLRSTVNLSFVDPGLGTANAGLAHKADGFFLTAPSFSRQRIVELINSF